ncbi:hypothetical protein, partial [Aliiglaciecola litoralis]|uniref:hypothetical protein n=1 Tax=Aliiglaciecola litoralis TaxID=582857 RepID=UPI0031CF5A95
FAQVAMIFVVDKTAQRLMRFLVIGFTLGALFSIYQITKGPELSVVIFMGVWLIGISFAALNIMKQPTTIEFDELSGEIRFSNRFKTSVHTVKEMEKIASENTVLTFSFSSKKIKMPNQITGLHKLIEKIKEANEHVEIIGC